MSVTAGIGEVSRLTGLSKDALRWYEREGLIPAVPRGSDGRRRYDDRTVGLIHLLLRLRRTGMPVAEIRRFIEMLSEGAASHGRRKALLAEHRGRILDQMRRLGEDMAALDAKIEHYDGLIAAGLDCGEEPITDQETLSRQRVTV